MQNNITPTLSLYDFIDTMDYIYECFKAECDLRDLQTKYPNTLDSLSIPFYSHNITIIISLLESIFHCTLNEDGYSTISYWVYETSCGSRFKKGDIVNHNLPEDHPYYTPDLRTAHDLYEYLVWEMNNNE